MARAQVDAGSSAAVSVAACVAAYESGQRERLSGSLRAARAAFLTCSQEACPRVARVDCASWLSEVERLSPSLVFSVKGPDGIDLPGATLTVDGALVEGLADGRALLVDPGTHLVRAAAPGLAPREQRLVVIEGEKARLVRFDFADAPVGPRASSPGNASPPSSVEAPLLGSAPRRSWLTPTAFGLAGAALVGFGAFGAWGLAGKSDLGACKPRCAHDAVARVERRFVVADVLLLVGLLSGGFATYRFLTTNDAAAVSASPGSPGFPGLTIDVAGVGRAETSLRVGGSF